MTEIMKKIVDSIESIINEAVDKSNNKYIVDKLKDLQEDVEDLEENCRDLAGRVDDLPYCQVNEVESECNCIYSDIDDASCEAARIARSIQMLIEELEGDEDETGTTEA